MLPAILTGGSCNVHRPFADFYLKRFFGTVTQNFHIGHISDIQTRRQICQVAAGGDLFSIDFRNDVFGPDAGPVSRVTLDDIGYQYTALAFDAVILRQVAFKVLNGNANPAPGHFAVGP